AVLIDDNFAFGRKGDVYVALIGKNPLYYKPFRNTPYDEEMMLTGEYDLIQEGRETFWITEVGTASEYGNFESFQQEIRSLPVEYDAGTLQYRRLQLTYRSDFLIDDKTVDLEYQRYESPYSHTERKSDVILFEYGGKTLVLDYYNNRREF
ncbi:MAG: hypothetical protein R6V86_00915, partial [Spirochaetia bacterium]